MATGDALTGWRVAPAPKPSTLGRKGASQPAQAMDEMIDHMVLNSTEGHLYVAELDTLSKR